MANLLLRLMFVLLLSTIVLAQDECCEEGDDLDGDYYCASVNDCNDNDPSVHPDAPELCDGQDNDCDGVLLPGEEDLDGDGVLACASDCDDTNAATYPGAEEICDGEDNDCDGEIPVSESDADGDGFLVCDGDCDDTDPNTYPGATELCDGLDNDCDGFVETDGGDEDGDGVAACSDCDDTDPDVYPGAEEICDGVDQDCDGLEDVAGGTSGAWNRSVCGELVGGGGSGLDTLGDDQPSVMYDPLLGKFRMWYRMIDGNDYAHAIGYAESDDGVHWTGYTAPVLAPGAEGEWDAVRLGYPSVLYLDGTYHMWYHGNETSTSIRIGHATSSDGITWQKDPANPVVDRGASGSWDQSAAHAPSVLFDSDEGIFKMWYAGYDGTNVRIGYATSPDGSVWTKYDPYVLDVGNTGDWDSKRVVFCRVLKSGGLYHMWYSGDDIQNTFTYEIGYAWSADGIAWNRDDNNPVFSYDTQDPASFDHYMVYAGDVVEVDGVWFMFYSGAPALSVPISIGVAVNDTPFTVQ